MSQTNSDKAKLNPTAQEFKFNPGANSWSPNPGIASVPPPTSTESLKSITSTPSCAKSSVPADADTLEIDVGKSKVSQESMDESLQDTKDIASETISTQNGTGIDMTSLHSELDDVKIPEKTKQCHRNDNMDEEVQHNQVEKENIEDEDPREHLNVVLIGHVDAGKSTLSGNILYIMEMVDKRTIERYEKEAKARGRESWFLAYIMDTGEEEREKGKTVEVGRAHFETSQRRYTILDTPGHKSYVPNMIQGASQADVGILVISARKGEFETGFERGGQTREHAMLAKTLGVNKLVVAINKMDEAEWSQDRFDECAAKLRPYLRSCGFAVKRDVTFIPISGLLGDNIRDQITKEKAPWYEGTSLIEHLDTMHIIGRDMHGPLRVPVLDRYHDRGTVAMGKVESGILKTGQKVILMPTQTKSAITQIYINEQPVRTAKPGENVTFRLPCGLDDIHKGFVICGSNEKDILKAITTFTAQIGLVDTLEHRPLLTAGYKCILHVHTIAEECCVVKLLRLLDPKNQKPIKKPVQFIRQGQTVICRIEVEQSISIDTFEHMPQLGRLTLRDEGKTIAIGKILTLGEKK